MATNPLLMTLVPNAKLPKKALAPGRLDFMGAMKKLKKESVFDIVRGAKSSFIRQVAEYSDADAALAYDNAMCYAVQIVRAFREQQISSGKKQTLTQGSGIRSLVEVGPSYPNLFKENWDDFCKPGAIEAKDSAPAYLCSLYRFAREEIESEAPAYKLLIDSRRPDLKDLVIDQQSTFTPVPMLNIVNQILSKGIEAHHQNDSGPSESVYERLMEKTHPFIFPYNFYHHQVRVCLSDKKPSLGEFYRLIIPELPIENFQVAVRDLILSNHKSLALLSGLSPQQINVLIAPTLFSDFYICSGDLSANQADTWRSPDGTSFCWWSDIRFGYIIPVQEGVTSTDPDATFVLASQGGFTTVALRFKSSDLNELSLLFRLVAVQDVANIRKLVNSSEGGSISARSLVLIYDPADNDGQLLPSGYSANFYTLASSTSALDGTFNPQRSFLKRTFTLVLDNDMGRDFLLSEAQNTFFETRYGTRLSTAGQNPLCKLDTFIAHTELTTDQVESLLAQRRHAPVLSANCLSKNLLREGSDIITPFTYASHYGASYVNGVGAHEAGTFGYKSADNSLGLVKQDGLDEQNKPVSEWVISNTSLNRFDRLQRMIRLQRWMNIPFNELDTLIVAAIRAEGEANLGMELNHHTLRTLGAFNFFNKHYAIKPQEFAAFLHYLTPFTTGDKKSLFDQVFNAPVLFDSPLVLDQQTFAVERSDPSGQQTIAQLATGLRLQPCEVVMLLNSQVKQYVGEPRRSLVIVSSLYRQSRMAHMLGLEVDEALTLLELLGGERYKKCWATGELSFQEEGASAVPDILDVLLELEWLVRWLNESQQTPKGLFKHLGLDKTVSVVPQNLVDRLNQLVKDANVSVVTAEQIQQLNLSIEADWPQALRKTLLDSNGLINPLPLTLVDEVPVQLLQRVTALVEEQTADSTTTADDIKQDVINKLTSFLVSAHDRQSRLVEGFVQETARLPMNVVNVLTQWAGGNVYGLLSHVVPQPSDFPFTSASVPVGLTTLLFNLFRYADVVNVLNLSESALRLFLVHPTWLGGEDTINLSLRTLFLLERYTFLIETCGKDETTVLNYFIHANSVVKGRISKAERNVLLAEKAAVIAHLLDWRRDEVSHLLTYLHSEVSTLAELEWLQRVKYNCAITGLSASGVVQTLNMRANSDTPQWKSLAEAVMAAAQYP